MLNEGVIRNLFVSFPSFDLGSIWRWFKVDEPVRPNSAEQEAQIVAAIMDPKARAPEGFVFLIPDGRYFFGPVSESNELYADRIEELKNPHGDIKRCPDLSNRFSNSQPFSKLGLGADSNPIEDKAVKSLIVKKHYKHRAPEKLIELSLV